MIVWSHRNVTNSILDLRTMLQMQRPDGRIPEMIFWSAPANATKPSGSYSSAQWADLTQMPVLPFSLRAIANAVGNSTAAATSSPTAAERRVELLKEFVPKLVKYFDWWADTRDVSGNGLVSIIHGWESGIDASPGG